MTWASRVTSASRSGRSRERSRALGGIRRAADADSSRAAFIFRIFATRAAVELERLRVERQLVESERRYRDLYEEAPNAYVSIGRELSLSEREPSRDATAWLLLRTGWFEHLGYFADSPSGWRKLRRLSTRDSPARRSPD